jgi:hypothetical protein
MRNRLLYAGFGVLATAVGVAAGHLVAALTEPAASPVLGGVLVLAAVAGLLARRRLAYGAALLVALVAIPALVATEPWPRPGRRPGRRWVLWWLTSTRTATEPRRHRSEWARGPGRCRVAGRRRGGDGGAGRWIPAYRTRTTAVDLPAATDPAPPLPPHSR